LITYRLGIILVHALLLCKHTVKNTASTSNGDRKFLFKVSINDFTLPTVTHWQLCALDCWRNVSRMVVHQTNEGWIPAIVCKKPVPVRIRVQSVNPSGSDCTAGQYLPLVAQQGTIISTRMIYTKEIT